MNKEFLNKRYKKEKRFILIGRVAVSLTIIFLVILLGSILLKGISGFYTTNIFLQTNLSQEIIDPQDKKNVEEIYKSSWRKIARNSIYDVLSAFNKSKNIDKISRKDKRDFLKLFSRSSEFYIRDFTLKNLDSIGKEVKISIPSSSLVDQFLKGKINIAVNEDDRPINDKQVSWINFMVENKMIERKFNINFFYKGDSRNAEEAGILGAIVGSFFVILVAIIVAFPVGVMSAIYLEEFAPKNKITNIIEVNINNLAAVPSIVFGLLGLAIFLNQTIFGIKLIKSLFFFPFVISQVVIGIIFSWFYNPRGVIGPLLDKIGLSNYAILADENFATYGIIFAGIYPQIAYCMILYLTGLNNLKIDQIEAGRMDGAKGFSLFKNIILPQLRPATFLAIVVTVIGSLRSFDMVAIMTQGGPYGSTNVLAYYMFETALSEYGYRMGYGSAIAAVLFTIMMFYILFFIYQMYQSEKKGL